MHGLIIIAVIIMISFVMIPFEKVRSRCNGNEDKEEWLLTVELTGDSLH